MSHHAPIRRTLVAAVALLLPLLVASTQAGDAPALRGCPQPPPPASFPDDEAIAPVHRDGVDCAVAFGLVVGRADGRFAPRPAVRRDQLASMVVRALERSDAPPLPEAGERFPDVPDASVHADAVHRLAAAGVLEGREDGRFEPEGPIARDQLASVLTRAVEWATGLEVEDADAAAFPDVAEGSVHRGGIGGAVSQGLLRGYDDGTFRPATSASRQQIATVVVALLDRLGTTHAPGPEVEVSTDPDGPLVGVPVEVEVEVRTPADGPAADVEVVVDLDGPALDEPTTATGRTGDDGTVTVEVTPDAPGDLIVDVDAPDLDGPATSVTETVPVAADPRPADLDPPPVDPALAAATDVTVSVGGTDAPFVPGSPAPPVTVTTTVDDPDGLLDEVTVAVTVLDDDGRDVLLDVYDPLVLDPVDAIGTPAPASAYEAGRTVTLTGEVAADAPTGDLSLAIVVTDGAGEALADVDPRTVSVVEQAPVEVPPDPSVTVALAVGEDGRVVATDDQRVGLQVRAADVGDDARVVPQLAVIDADGTTRDLDDGGLDAFPRDDTGAVAARTVGSVPGLNGDGGARTTLTADLTDLASGEAVLEVALVEVDAEGTTVAELGRDAVAIDVAPLPAAPDVAVDVPAEVVADELLTIDTTVTDAGEPVSGVPVEVTVTPADGESPRAEPEARVDLTDADGIAEAHTTVDGPGDVTVEACAAGTCATTEVTVAPAVRTAPTAQLTLTTTPEPVREGDELEAAFTARLVDPDGVVDDGRPLQLAVALTDASGVERLGDATRVSAFEPRPAGVLAPFTPAQRPAVRTAAGTRGDATLVFSSRARGTYTLQVSLIDATSGATLGSTTSTITVEAPPPAPTDSVVMDELATRGPAGAGDEFVELRNPTDRPIDVSGWQLRSCNDRGFVATRVTIPAATVLRPGERYLAASTTFSGAATPDGPRFQGAITDRGGVLLRDTALRKVDGVGFAVGSAACVEGDPATNVTVAEGLAGLTPQRTASGVTTGDNASDFRLAPRDPRGSRD